VAAAAATATAVKKKMSFVAEAGTMEGRDLTHGSTSRSGIAAW
jgi:hypothetical protein